MEVPMTAIYRFWKNCKWLVGLGLCLLLFVTPACESLLPNLYSTVHENKEPANETPPEESLPTGSNEITGTEAAPEEPTLPPAPTEASQTVGNPVGNLKPVGFVNRGSIATTVTAETFIPLGANKAATPSDASTIAFPPTAPGVWPNSSRFLLLPLGTYTWCYHWELGDINNDQMIEYAHAIDNRPVLLDVSDSDDLDKAEQVDLSAPPGSGELPGRCRTGETTTEPGETTATYKVITAVGGFTLVSQNAWTLETNVITLRLNPTTGVVVGEGIRRATFTGGDVETIFMQIEGTYNPDTQQVSGVFHHWGNFIAGAGSSSSSYVVEPFPASFTATWGEEVVTGYHAGFWDFVLQVQP